MKKIELRFSDLEVGTDEYGYITRIPDEDPDDEDLRYGAYVTKTHGVKARCVLGYLYVR